MWFTPIRLRHLSPYKGYGVHTSGSKLLTQGVVGSIWRWKIQ